MQELGSMLQKIGATRAAKQYSAVWGIPINKSTARRLKSQYLEKLRKESLEQRKKLAESQEASTSGESIVITELETNLRGRPLLLGVELDTLIQEFINNLRAAVNATIVMGAAEGIISYRDASKPSSNGGHIEITKS